MFRKLRRRLVFLYGFTTSFILLLIMIGLNIITFNQNQTYIKDMFQKNVEQLAEKIQVENKIDKTWFVNYQMENHVLISIEENGKELTAYNHFQATKASEKYRELIKELAAKEGINLNIKPLFPVMEKTAVHHIGKNALDTRYGMAVNLPRGEGWLSIIAIYQDDNSITALVKQILLYAFIDLIGTIALFIISSLYIGNVLKPLEEGQRKQNAFVAAASHELRSPLTVIKAGISSIKQEEANEIRFLPHIEEECDRMTRLIDDMLTLATANAKTWSLYPERVDMTILLIESYDMFCSIYPNRNNQLSLELPEEKLHEIYGDKERLKQTLTILVENAVSYSPECGQITLRAYNHKRFVCVEVEDHGIGISDEDKMLVFDRFYRADKSRKDKKHFGLGLSVAKELADLHRGEISIKDTEGGGATFVLQLPWLMKAGPDHASSKQS